MGTKHIIRVAAVFMITCLSLPASAQIDCGTSSKQFDLQCVRQQNNLKIDKTAVSVSGISSGAFMAHQFHVAHSAHIMGVGIVAGGPYYCAEANVVDAISKCSEFALLTCQEQMKLSPFGTNICSLNYIGPKNDQEAIAVAGASFAEARKLSGSRVDDVKSLRGAKVYLFRGESDKIVPLGIMQAVYHFYTDQDKGSVNPLNVKFNDTFAVRHSMVTDNFYQEGKKIVGPCNPAGHLSDDSYITDCRQEALDAEAKNDCVCTSDGCHGNTPASDEICINASQVDLAGAILTHIYGPLQNRERLAPPELSGPALDAQLSQYVQSFDQKAIFSLFDSLPETALLSASMAEDGYIYIPEACKSGATCRLHIALHGCLQGDKTGDSAGDGYSGNLYSKYAGYNEWAKNNNIIVVYPQVRKFNGTWLNPPVNPQGCWDWWGQYYTYENYHTKVGSQIKAVAQMINVLVNDNQFLEVPK